MQDQGQYSERRRAVATLERDRCQSQEKFAGMVAIDSVSRNLLPTRSGAMLIVTPVMYIV